MDGLIPHSYLLIFDDPSWRMRNSLGYMVFHEYLSENPLVIS